MIPGSLLRRLTNDAAGVIKEYVSMGEDCGHIGEAERWASAIQCVIASDSSFDCVSVSELLEHAESEGGAAGALLAGAVAAYGPLEARSRARRLRQRLSAGSPGVPAWVACLGEVVPLRAVRIADEWDEYSIVMVDYERPDGTVHALVVWIHPFYAGMADRFALLDGGMTVFLGERFETAAGSGEEIVECSSPQSLELAKHFYHGNDRLVVESLELSAARAIIEAGLRTRDVLQVDYADPIDQDDDDDVDDLEALVAQRLEFLPLGGSPPEQLVADPEVSASLLAEFAALPVQPGEHTSEFKDFLHMMRRFSAFCVDRDALAWTRRGWPCSLRAKPTTASPMVKSAMNRTDSA